jgi:hypothetical protein
MSLSTRSIITSLQAKQYLGINDTAFDGFIDSWIDLASGRVEAHLRRKVKSQEIEEILDGTGTYTLCPRYSPIISIVGDTENDQLGNVQYRDSVSSSWTNLLTDIDVLVMDEHRPWELVIGDESTVWPIGWQNIRLEYNAGWTDVPAEIQMVVIEMVAKAYQESNVGRSSLGVSSSSVGQAGGSGSVSFLDLTDRWMKMLQPYRLMV